MTCSWCCFGSGDYRPEEDDMGSIMCGKGKPADVQDTQPKKESEGAGGDAYEKSALEVGTSVKRTSSSQDVLEEEEEKWGENTTDLANQHSGRGADPELKECGNGSQIKPLPSALSNVGPHVDTPAFCSGGRESSSPPPEAPPLPSHIMSQVSKHPPTHLTAGGGGAASGSGSNQQLVSSMKPQTDNSDSHQWGSDEAQSPTSPGGAGSHAHEPDVLSNKVTAKEEEGGGSHSKDDAPSQDCDSGEGRTSEPAGPAQEKKAAGPETAPTPGSDVHTEPQTGAAPDTGSKKDKPKDTQRKEELEGAGGDAHVTSALEIGTSVKPTGSSSSQVVLEEGEKSGVDTARLATQHSGREVNLELKECDGGLQIEPSLSAFSSIGPCVDTPTSCSDSRKSPSPPTAACLMPPHLMPQVSKHSPTHYSVSGGGATSGSGSDQQLVSSMEPQTDNSDSHRWRSDGAQSPTSPGGAGGHAHKPDGLSNKVTAEEKKNEEGGGSHLKNEAPPQDHDSGEGRTAEPAGPVQEKEAAGPEPTLTPGGEHAELWTGAAPDTGSSGVGLGEGIDSHKQQQGKAASLGRCPGAPQRVQTSPSPGAEALLSPVKCLDCERELSAKEVQQRQNEGEALLCDTCRSAHLSCLQDDSDSDGKGVVDQASADTRSSPDVVLERPMCKLPGCTEQADVKGKKYYEFCSKGHYQMYDMMTPSPVSLKPSTSQRSPTSLTGPSHSGGGEGRSCEYPGCSEVRAVEGSGRILACCEVHHKEEERHLKEFQECSGGRGGDGGGLGGDGSGQEGDGGGQGGDGGGEGGDSGFQRGESGGQGGGGGGQEGDSGSQEGDGGGQGGDSGGLGGDGGGGGGDDGGQEHDGGGQGSDSGDQGGGGGGGGGGGDDGGQEGDGGSQERDGGGQGSDSGDQGGGGGGQGGDSGSQEGDNGGQRGGGGGQSGKGGGQRGGSGGQKGHHSTPGHGGGPYTHDRSSRGGGGGHTPQHHPPAPTPRHKTCRYPKCERPCYVEQDGHVHDFCGRTHAQQYRSEQTCRGRAAQSQHKDEQSQGIIGWMTGMIGWRRESNAIRFYNKGEPYYEFTNFYQAPLQIDGKDWATSENYFQAQKYIGTPLYDAIQQSRTAREAFDISRTPVIGLQWRRCDWEEVKEDVMYVALYSKFTQHEHLMDMLLDTGNHKLVEHTSRDSYWGDGGDGSGQNKLGKLLMRLREELKKEMEAVAGPAPQGGRKRKNESVGQPRAKKSSASDIGSSVD